jgi:hypothetical protein
MKISIVKNQKPVFGIWQQIRYSSYHVNDWFFGVVFFLVFNATFNNISVISWLSVLLVEETGVPGENRRPAASEWVSEWGFTPI